MIAHKCEDTSSDPQHSVKDKPQWELLFVDLAGWATASVRNKDVKTLVKDSPDASLCVPDAPAHPLDVGFSGS